ncbi:peroxisomal membrane protein 11B [Macrosteles quadrilineatus]|uniref:peroxisomal membrane protein 11B n=1 Tax=Macrosteles quadrilineatus TaxID=74068 RepID=UPI0023E33894|nr:peroxisomal membrane protein 11B [Macrosteles quadrilineatus]
MNKIVKFNNQTAGRDKLARLLQYASRVTWYYMHQLNASHKSIDAIKSLEFTLSTFRKLLRMGRFLDTLYSALAAMHYAEAVVRYTSTFSKIAHAVYLFCDHLLWLARAGFADLNTDKWVQRANKCWLYSITMNLVRDVYEINRLLEANKAKSQRKASVSLTKLALQNKDLVVDTLKNGCDFFIPLTALGYVRLSPGTVGMLGVVSSVAGILTIVNPMYKLCPP